MRKFRSRLSHKIMGMIIASGAVMMCVMIAVSMLIVLPRMWQEAVKSANADIKLIVQHAESKIELIRAYASNIADSYDLKAELRSLYAAPDSKDIEARIVRELDNKKSEMPSVQKIAVQHKVEEIITTTRTLSDEEQKLFASGEYLYFTGLDYAKRFFYVYKVPYSSDYMWGNEPPESYIAAYCMNFYVDDERYTLTIFVEINDIMDITESLAGHTLDSYIWLDSFRSPFESYGDHDINRMVNRELIDNLLYNYDMVERDKGYLFLHTLSGSKWIFGAYVSDKTLLSNYGQTILMTISLFFALIIIVTFLSLPIVNRFTNPLRELTASMRKVAAGDLTVVSEVQSNDEVGELSYVFCNMVRQLNVHIDKLIEKEKIEQRMRYSLLISEIDPHFIYNTMNTINYLARKGRDKDIILINTALIKILQDRLRIGKIEVFDSVSQEVDMLRQYMIVQKFRFNNVNIVWDIPPELWDEQLPKNMLQPLVENALLHGLTNDEGEPVDGDGCVEIKIQKEDDNLVIEVMDNGRGMSEEKMEELNRPKPKSMLESMPENRGRHIGINNIRERLAYIYGGEGCIRVSKREQGGICVTVTLPLKQSRYNVQHSDQ